MLKVLHTLVLDVIDEHLTWLFPESLQLLQELLHKGLLSRQMLLSQEFLCSKYSTQSCCSSSHFVHGLSHARPRDGRNRRYNIYILCKVKDE